MTDVEAKTRAFTGLPVATIVLTLRTPAFDEFAERPNDFGHIDGARALALRLTRSTLQRLRLLALFVVASAAAGGLYSVIQAPPDFNWVVQVATGSTIGGVISSCIIGFELFGAGQLLERGGRRLPLVAAVLLRTIVYGVVIMAALLIFPRGVLR